MSSQKLDGRAPAFLRPVPKGDEQPSKKRRMSRKTAANLVRHSGTTLVALSAFVLVWTGWEVVGSNMSAARKQSALEEQFNALADSNEQTPQTPADSKPDPVFTDLPDDGSVSPAPATPPSTPPEFAVIDDDHVRGVEQFVRGDYGDLAGRVRIPAIDVDTFVSFGTGLDVLDSGPGVWEYGAVPGNPGNATLAGHRTTHGGPFRHLDSLQPGDRIFFEIPGQPTSVFEVRGFAVVEPDNVSVTGNTEGVRLTLTTCTPVGSTAQRLIVQAELVEGAYVDLAVPADRWTFQGDL